MWTTAGLDSNDPFLGQRLVSRQELSIFSRKDILTQSWAKKTEVVTIKKGNAVSYQPERLAALTLVTAAML